MPAMGEMAGKTAPASKCRKHKCHMMSQCVHHLSFCIWVKGTQILALITVFAKVIIILPSFYVSTLNQRLPGAGRMFKALWDRSAWILFIFYLYVCWFRVGPKPYYCYYTMLGQSLFESRVFYWKLIVGIPRKKGYIIQNGNPWESPPL